MIGVEQCDRCGFDRRQWNEHDAARTIAQAGALLVEWSADAPPELMDKLDARRIDDLKSISTSPDLFDEVHHLWHGLVSIADVRRAAGDVVRRQRGAVTQLSASAGGVPKTAVGSATIGVRGIDGDVQAARAHHGSPWQALCLWSQEVIDALAREITSGEGAGFGIQCGGGYTVAAAGRSMTGRTGADAVIDRLAFGCVTRRFYGQCECGRRRAGYPYTQESTRHVTTPLGSSR